MELQPHCAVNKSEGKKSGRRANAAACCSESALLLVGDILIFIPFLFWGIDIFDNYCRKLCIIIFLGE